MASPNVYQTGIGGSSGAELVSVSPLMTSGDIWYVSSTSGSDAAAPRGKERIRPLATLAQAHTNAAANDTIVLLSGHQETLTAAQTFNKAGLLVLGEGLGTTRPRFTRNGNVNMFDITAAGVRVENIYFVASASASALSRLRFAGANNRCINCYFEHGSNDTGPGLETITGASQVRVTDTTFISTSTDVTAQPESAIKVTNAITDLEVNTCVLNGASSGWSNPYAFNGAGAITRLYGINVDLLGDSDAIFATGTTGVWHVRNRSGSARVVWTA